MKKIQFNIIVSILFVFLSGLPFTCSALEIAPTSLFYKDNSQLKTLRLFNETNQTVQIQATVYKWSLENNKQKLSPTEDLFPSPTIFSIAPQQSLSLRVGLFTQNSSSSVSAYRLDLKELPPKAQQQSGQNSVNVLYNITLPIFIYPNHPIKDSWKWHKVKKRQEIQFTNTGETVLGFKQLSFIDTNGSKHAIQPKRYILPGQTVSFRTNPKWNIKSIEQVLNNLKTSSKSKISV